MLRSHSPTSKRGAALTELLLSISIAGITLGTTAALLAIGSRTLPDESDSVDTSLMALEIANQIAQDIRDAEQIVIGDGGTLLTLSSTHESGEGASEITKSWKYELASSSLYKNSGSGSVLVTKSVKSFELRVYESPQGASGIQVLFLIDGIPQIATTQALRSDQAVS